MVEKIERVSTGIPGLDKLIEGGIPKGSAVLVSGGPGTGKTTIGMQFMDVGLKKNEKCVYVTIEGRPEEVIAQGKQIGLFRTAIPDIRSAKDMKYDIGLGKKPEDAVAQTKLVAENIKKTKPIPSRVVIDSISTLSVENKALARKCILLLIEELKKMGCTTLLIGESLEGVYPDDTAPFLVDALVLVYYLGVGGMEYRSLEIRKMRLTNHIKGYIPFEIKRGKGIVVREGDIRPI